MGDTWFKKIILAIESNSVLTGLLLLLISVLWFSWIQYAPSFADPDSFYHIKIAEMMSRQGIVRDFPYLQFTTLKDAYIDHHFLYHVYLVPFVKYLPPVIGVKIAHIILASAMVVVFFWLLKKLQVKGAFWFTLLLFLCNGFMFRLNLVKAQPASIIILLVGTYFIMQKKYGSLFGLSFLYVWVYGGWFLLLIMALIYVFTVALDSLTGEMIWPIKNIFTNSAQIIRLVGTAFLAPVNRKIILAALAGLGLGIIINPYFPRNLSFYWVQIVEIGFRNFKGVIGVGSEWYPYDAVQLLKNALVSLVFYALSLIIFFSHYKKFDVKVKFLFMVASFFMVATIRARRNIEYLAPFVLLFSATLLAAGWNQPVVRKDLLAVKQWFHNLWLANKVSQILFTIIIFGALGVVIFSVPMQIKKSIGNRINFNYLGGASAYMSKNSSPGDIVFNCGWDYFPELFYHNDKNYYIVGLDTTFMYLDNKDLYFKWADVTQGKRRHEIYRIIKNDFRAKFVITKVDQKRLITNLDSNFNFIKVYSDNEAIVYQVL